MKQGRAGRDVSESSKREPIAHKVNIGAVTDMGATEVRSGSGGVPLYAGRGLEAPMNSIATHKGGSQGKY